MQHDLSLLSFTLRITTKKRGYGGMAATGDVWDCPCLCPSAIRTETMEKSFTDRTNYTHIALL